jgi:hypothetical protein
MVVFPEETKFYQQWKEDMESRGVKLCVDHQTLDADGSRLNTEVTRIVERSKHGVKLYTRPRRVQPDLHNPVGADQDLPESLEQYDELVLNVLADTAKRLLGKTGGWFERAVLGSAKWSDDVTVTHNVSTVHC